MRSSFSPWNAADAASFSDSLDNKQRSELEKRIGDKLEDLELALRRFIRRNTAHTEFSVLDLLKLLKQPSNVDSKQNLSAEDIAELLKTSNEQLLESLTKKAYIAKKPGLTPQSARPPSVSSSLEQKLDQLLKLLPKNASNNPTKLHETSPFPAFTDSSTVATESETLNSAIPPVSGADNIVKPDFNAEVVPKPSANSAYSAPKQHKPQFSHSKHLSGASIGTPGPSNTAKSHSTGSPVFTASELRKLLAELEIKDDTAKKAAKRKHKYTNSTSHRKNLLHPSFHADSDSSRSESHSSCDSSVDLSSSSHSRSFLSSSEPPSPKYADKHVDRNIPLKTQLGSPLHSSSGNADAFSNRKHIHKLSAAEKVGLKLKKRAPPYPTEKTSNQMLSANPQPETGNSREFVKPKFSYTSMPQPEFLFPAPKFAKVQSVNDIPVFSPLSSPLAFETAPNDQTQSSASLKTGSATPNVRTDRKPAEFLIPTVPPNFRGQGPFSNGEPAPLNPPMFGVNEPGAWNPELQQRDHVFPYKLPKQAYPDPASAINNPNFQNTANKQTQVQINASSFQEYGANPRYTQPQKTPQFNAPNPRVEPPVSTAEQFYSLNTDPVNYHDFKPFQTNELNPVFVPNQNALGNPFNPQLQQNYDVRSTANIPENGVRPAGSERRYSERLDSTPPQPIINGLNTHLNTSVHVSNRSEPVFDPALQSSHSTKTESTRVNSTAQPQRAAHFNNARLDPSIANSTILDPNNSLQAVPQSPELASSPIQPLRPEKRVNKYILAKTQTSFIVPQPELSNRDLAHSTPAVNDVEAFKRKLHPELASSPPSSIQTSRKQRKYAADVFMSYIDESENTFTRKAEPHVPTSVNEFSTSASSSRHANRDSNAEQQHFTSPPRLTFSSPDSDLTDTKDEPECEPLRLFHQQIPGLSPQELQYYLDVYSAGQAAVPLNQSLKTELKQVIPHLYSSQLEQQTAEHLEELAK